MQFSSFARVADRFQIGILTYSPSVYINQKNKISFLLDQKITIYTK